MKTYITAGTVFTPDETLHSQTIAVESGVIEQVGPRSAFELPANARDIDLGAATLAPAFIDIHVHGGGGFDFMRANPSELDAIEAFLATHGVAAYCPTTVTAPMLQTEKALEKLGDRIRGVRPAAGRAQPLGIHLEGPFLSHAKRGVHPSADLLPPSPWLVSRFLERAQRQISLITLAPELAGAAETIAFSKQQGIRLSLGHSNADTLPVRAAVDAGASHVTHTFNAMRPLDHRDPGILGVALSDDRLYADIIADGIHVEPAMLKLFLRAKGRDRAILITDAISATGMPDGVYELGGLQVEVKSGVARSEGKLAGSLLTMDRAVWNVCNYAALPLREAVALATLNPARMLGITDQRGVIAPGRFADFTVFSEKGDLVRTIVHGDL